MNWVVTAGVATNNPTKPLCQPGAINNNAEAAKTQRSQTRIVVKKYAENDADNSTKPTIQPLSVITKSCHVNPFKTNKSEGENTNTNGTSNLLMPNLKAVLPV